MHRGSPHIAQQCTEFLLYTFRYHCDSVGVPKNTCPTHETDRIGSVDGWTDVWRSGY